MDMEELRSFLRDLSTLALRGEALLTHLESEILQQNKSHHTPLEHCVHCQSSLDPHVANRDTYAIDRTENVVREVQKSLHTIQQNLGLSSMEHSSIGVSMQGHEGARAIPHTRHIDDATVERARVADSYLAVVNNKHVVSRSEKGATTSETRPPPRPAMYPTRAMILKQQYRKERIFIEKYAKEHPLECVPPLPLIGGRVSPRTGFGRMASSPFSTRRKHAHRSVTPNTTYMNERLLVSNTSPVPGGGECPSSATEPRRSATDSSHLTRHRMGAGTRAVSVHAPTTIHEDPRKSRAQYLVNDDCARPLLTHCSPQPHPSATLERAEHGSSSLVRHHITTPAVPPHTQPSVESSSPSTSSPVNSSASYYLTSECGIAPEISIPRSNATNVYPSHRAQFSDRDSISVGHTTNPVVNEGHIVATTIPDTVRRIPVQAPESEPSASKRLESPSPENPDAKKLAAESEPPACSNPAINGEGTRASTKEGNPVQCNGFEVLASDNDDRIIKSELPCISLIKPAQRVADDPNVLSQHTTIEESKPKDLPHENISACNGKETNDIVTNKECVEMKSNETSEQNIETSLHIVNQMNDNASAEPSEEEIDVEVARMFESGWCEKTDPKNRKYYFNKKEKRSVWNIRKEAKNRILSQMEKTQ